MSVENRRCSRQAAASDLSRSVAADPHRHAARRAGRYVWPGSADALKPLGDLFIKLVRMLVGPIIFCTVVHGIASVREAKTVGRSRSRRSSISRS
jgi:hypothetical protein